MRFGACGEWCHPRAICCCERDVRGADGSLRTRKHGWGHGWPSVGSWVQRVAARVAGVVWGWRSARGQKDEASHRRCSLSSRLPLPNRHNTAGRQRARKCTVEKVLPSAVPAKYRPCLRTFQLAVLWSVTDYVKTSSDRLQPLSTLFCEKEQLWHSAQHALFCRTAYLSWNVLCQLWQDLALLKSVYSYSTLAN